MGEEDWAGEVYRSDSRCFFSNLSREVSVCVCVYVCVNVSLKMFIFLLPLLRDVFHIAFKRVLLVYLSFPSSSRTPHFLLMTPPWAAATDTDVLD